MVKERKIERAPFEILCCNQRRQSDGMALLDLNYEEDSRAEVDMNVVMTGSGRFVEIQGTAEGAVFTKKEMDQLTEMAQKGIKDLTRIQKKSWREEDKIKERMEILVATRNRGKIREIRKALKGLRLQIHSLTDFRPHPRLKRMARHSQRMP